MGNIITPVLPHDLPENWNDTQYVSPGGTEVGPTEKHGYNYLMKQVNNSQKAINELDAELEDIHTTLQNKAPKSLTYGSSNVASEAEIDAFFKSAYAETGNYSVANYVLNVTVGGLSFDGGAHYVTIHKFFDNTGFVTVKSYGYKMTYTRYANIFNSEWGPWEWLNPPMTIGIEYRTTERWLGYPVYVKTINFGAMTNGKSVEVAKNPRHVVRCSAVIGEGNGTLPEIVPQALSQSVCFTANITQNDAGERVAVTISRIGTSLGDNVTATVAVWYTKLSD